MIDEILLEQVAVGIASLAAFYVIYYVFDGALLGPEHDYWNGFRAAVLPGLSKAGIEFGPFQVNRVHDSEFACTVRGSLEDIEQMLHEAGYDRNLLAGIKVREGGDGSEQYEATSWAKRHSDNPAIPDALSIYQTHVFAFDNEDGTFDLYAHHEYNSMNPVVAFQHAKAVGQTHTRGVQNFKQDLDEIPLLDPIEILRE